MSAPQSSGSSWINWVAALLAVAAIGFVSLNILLHRTNLSLQEQLADRQQFINESIRLSRFNTELIQALATLAAQSDDPDLRALLSNHGISFTVTPPVTGGSAEASKGDGHE